jgi:hypothetical protein
MEGGIFTARPSTPLLYICTHKHAQGLMATLFKEGCRMQGCWGQIGCWVPGGGGHLYLDVECRMPLSRICWVQWCWDSLYRSCRLQGCWMIPLSTRCWVDRYWEISFHRLLCTFFFPVHSNCEPRSIARELAYAYKC